MISPRIREGTVRGRTLSEVISYHPLPTRVSTFHWKFMPDRATRYFDPLWGIASINLLPIKVSDWGTNSLLSIVGPMAICPRMLTLLNNN